MLDLTALLSLHVRCHDLECCTVHGGCSLTSVYVEMHAVINHDNALTTTAFKFLK